MRRVTIVGLASLLMLVTAAEAQASRCRRMCGGCSDPCISSSCGGCLCGRACAPKCQPLDVGPVKAMKIVMVPEYVTEKCSVCCTECREEERTRPVTVYKSVPVEEERVCLETVYVPKTETKTVEYTVSVPVKEMKTKEYKTTVPVWTEEEEKYTVKVPEIVEVTETYTVKVPVVEEVECEYTVMVPQAEKRTVMRNVCNVVPVEKTRTLKHCVPILATKLVDRDYGHWETKVVEADCCGAGRCCSGCGRCCCAGPKVACKRVWVPNVVKEEVTCVKEQYQTQEVKYLAYESSPEQVPYECVSICYKPEKRKGTRKVVKYTNETRTRKRPDVQYKDEVRTRTKKVLSFREETRTETYPVIRHDKETRTKEVSYTVKVPEQREKKYTVTRYDCVPEKKLEKYTVCVPVPVVKEVDVQFCRMVPKVVSVTVNPCACCTRSRCCCRCGE